MAARGGAPPRQEEEDEEEEELVPSWLNEHAAQQAWKHPPKGAGGRTRNLCRPMYRLQGNLRDNEAQPADTPEWLNKHGSTPQTPSQGVDK